MKYLLNFLEKHPDSVGLSDEELQKLLIDVQVGKSTAKSNDDFYESMEKVVNELKSSPESVAFHKPVSKRDAPDYHLFVPRPMDLSTVLRNIKAHKYRSKGEFAADLDLIWENCLLYNSHESHPLRGAARFMQQKTKHHLEFLVDRSDRQSRVFSLGGSRAGSFAPSNVQPSPAPAADDDDGMDDDADGEIDTDGLTGSKTKGGMANGSSLAQSQSQGRHGTPNGRSRSRSFRDGSQAAVVDGAVASKVASPSRSTVDFSIDTVPAVTRSAATMSNFHRTCEAGPSYSDKGKAKELLSSYTVPTWYPPVDDEDEEAALDGQWWGALGEEALLAGGVPSVPMQIQQTAVTSPLPTRRKSRRRSSPGPAAQDVSDTGEVLNGINKPRRHRPVKLAKAIMQTVDDLAAVRRTQNKILEFQRLEADGAPLPRVTDPAQDEDEIEAEEQTKAHRKAVKTEAMEAAQRARQGAETGEIEATESLRQASAALLAHAGFEGANETALNTFTRVAADQLANLGKTFRLFMDRFSKRMSAEEIILHVLFENGAVAPETLEGYIRDDIDRNGAKISDLLKKTRQAYVDVARAPVIEDDMLFAQDGEMLITGNFTEELGEDFFGLRELGLDKEFNMSSLSIPASLFHGRGKRAAATAEGAKGPAIPDYPPPPPFVPLTAALVPAQIGLLRSFYTARIAAGRDLADDDFDPTHAAIGSLGQIVVKQSAGAAKRKSTGVGKGQQNGSAPKKKKTAAQPGVGKGNWVRPPKEERQRRAEEKRLRLEAQAKLVKMEGTASPTAA